MRTGAPATGESAAGTDQDRSRLRRALIALCVTEITSWGVLYYAFPVMLSSLTADTGWSTATAMGAFSAGAIVSAIAGVPVGRLIDRHGPRPVMTVGAFAGVIATVAIAAAPSLPWFFAAWMLAGPAQAALLYPPAFAAITGWYGPGRVRALTTLTLVAGLSSTVFAPLVAVLLEHLHWRTVYLLLAAVLAAVVIPLHALCLTPPWRPAAPARRDPATRDPATYEPATYEPAARDPASREQASRGPVAREQASRDSAACGPAARERAARDSASRGPALRGRATRGRATRGPAACGREPYARAVLTSRGFVTLAAAMALAAFGMFAATVNLVPLFTSRGMGNQLAALALGLCGAGQLLGRVGYAPLARRTTPRTRTAGILAAGAVTVVALGLLPGPAVPLIAVAVLAGMARGIFTLLQATAVADRWGTAAFGHINGVFTAPTTAVIALAPGGGALIADLAGGYPAGFTLLALLPLAAAAAALVTPPARATRHP